MLDRLPILAIETSQSNCGACVFFDDEKFFELNLNFKNLHAEKIYEVIDSALKLSGVGINQIGSIAISAGPGSFTGLRIGMSAAKAIAFGAALPIIPVPTFEAIAFQLAFYFDNETEFVIANKVNSEEIFTAKFKVKSNSYIFVQEVEIVKLTNSLFRNEDCKIIGNINEKNNLEKSIIPISYPKAEFVAKWALYFGINKLLFDFDLLEPNYLKKFLVKGG